jgi:prepilin-type processing-associated H-X9-DG protein
MSYITAIATANPVNRFSQSTIAEFMQKKMQLKNGQSRKLKSIFKYSGIAYRHSVLNDYGRTKDFEFYPETEIELFPSTQRRLAVFREHALSLSVVAVNKLIQSASHFKANEITHLIVVCCTGMYAPGLDIELVNALKLPTTVQRTAINFMGCYAAINALKVADAFCKSDSTAKVLVVCTELCSLHFQREDTEDNLIANALFADGSAAVLVESHSASALTLSLESFHSDLATQGSEDMAWHIGDLGFEMKLSAYVPAIIQSGISSLTDSLLQKISKKFSDIKHFAIHPGGKRILEVIEQELGISKDQNKAAYEVLKNYGNMSSPTILFVLEELIKSLNNNDIGEHILSFAFGPGLTLESMVLTIKNV